MNTLVNAYRTRAANGRKVLLNAKMGKMFLPFMYLTAALGCWKNISSYGTMRIGDLSLSVAITVLLGVCIYDFAALAVVHVLLRS